MSSVDGNTIKTLMTMSEVAKKRAKDLPLVVAEILDERKSTIAKKAYKGPIEIVLSNTYLSRLITQNLRNNGLSEVNAELLGHEWGNEVYLRDTDDLIGFRVHQLFSIFMEAIPIGIVRTLEGKIEPLLVPDFNETIREHDRIILIAEDFDKTKSTKTVSIENKIFNSKEFNLKEKKLRKILILGWNHRIPSILKEFDKYNKENTTLTIVSRTSVERREELITMMGIELTTINICHIVSDFTSPSELKACQPSENDAILLVASDLTESDASTDARTILGYLLLLELFHNVKSKPHILIELLDIENKKLLKDKNCEIVVTPVVISHLLTHVSLRRELNVVFEELFGPDGAEINFIPLKIIDHVNEAISFEEIQQQCIEAGVICIGFRKFHDDKYHTILNPEKNKKFNFIEKDRLIIIAN